MLKIYGDGYFNTLDPRFKFYEEDYDKLPNNCDIVGISLYNNIYESLEQTIEQYLSKTSKLFVNISEPTHKTLVPFLQKYKKESRIHFFGDVVFPQSVDNFSTVLNWFIEPINYYANHSWAKNLISQIKQNEFNKPKIFNCLLGLEKPDRDLIENLYQNSIYKNKIYFSYYKNLGQIDNLGIWDDVVRSNKSNVHNVVLDNKEISRYSIIPVDCYNQTYYSIVSDSTTFNEYNMYTEKVAKPMIASQPFIAFCGQHYLKNLRNLGFRTFSTVIDENYDNEPDIDKRFKMAWQQVELLCTLDPKHVLSELKGSLDHNYKHFLTTDWWAPIRKFL